MKKMTENLNKKAADIMKEKNISCVLFVKDKDTGEIIRTRTETAAESLAATLLRRYLIKTECIKRITRAPWYEMGGSIITATMSDRCDYIYYFKD